MGPATNPLLDVLRRRSSELASQAEKLIAGAAERLIFSVATFPSGTDHTQRHTHAVEQIGRMLLTDDFIAAMRDEELYLLVLACHYHDLGMSGAEADDADADSREHVRREHAVKVAQSISARWDEIGFPDKRTAEVLGEVCRGHRPEKRADGTATWDNYNEFEILGFGKEVRLRLLCSLIYAIDELHLGADRAPIALERWRGIEDEDARRHWRRHQAINGPVPRDPDLLCFAVSAETPGFEADLRKSIRKALMAVESLREQSQLAGMQHPIRQIVIDWNRDAQWELILAEVASDNVPRQKHELAAAVRARHEANRADQLTLAEICVEAHDSNQEIVSRINRVVGDALVQGRLKAAPEATDKFVLAEDARRADELIARARKADSLDHLFVGRYRTGWEQRLFASEYGRSYARNIVAPKIEERYSVRLSLLAAEHPVRILLEKCPSAAGLASHFAPHTDNLVKDDLLLQMVTAGAMADIHTDPNRLLEQSVRAALHMLAKANTELKPTLRFLEELALVGALSHQEVHRAMVVSKAAREALTGREDATAPSITMTVAQGIPRGDEAQLSFSHLVYAAQRAGTKISVASAKEHDLELDLNGPGMPAPNGAKPVMLTVGPPAQARATSANVPAALEVDASSRTVRFVMGIFSADGPTPHEVVLRVPLPGSGDTRVTGTLRCSVAWPELSIRDVQNIEAANELARSGSFRIEMVNSDGGSIVASGLNGGGAPLFSISDRQPSLGQLLAGIDVGLPAPVLVDSELLQEIGNLPLSDRPSKWAALREVTEAEKPHVGAIYLRLSAKQGVTVDERFLGFLSFDFMSAPVLEDGAVVPQEEFSKKWDRAGEDFLITCSFEDDVYALADALAAWVKEPSKEFPFRITGDSATTPTTRSVMSVRVLKRRDRIWHVDRPYIFEFRPVDRRERYAAEASYWRKGGDEARALLAEEIGARGDE